MSISRALIKVFYAVLRARVYVHAVCAHVEACACAFISFGQAQPDQGRETDGVRCGQGSPDVSSSDDESDDAPSNDDDAEEKVPSADAGHVAYQALLSFNVMRNTFWLLCLQVLVLVVMAWKRCTA